MSLPFDLTYLTAAFMAVVLFGAAFVRGYSGFGFSALVVTGGSLVTNPLNLVPVVIFCEFLMTFQQWRGVGADVDWPRVRWLWLGALVGVPIGLWLITQVPVDAARAVVAIYVLAMCGVLLRGWKLQRVQGAVGHTSVGAFAGLANALGMAGLPVATYFTAQTMRARAFRATLIAYFAGLDVFTFPLLWWHELVTMDTAITVVAGAPFMVLGIWLGGRQFLSAEPQEFRRFAIALLMVLAILGLVKAVI
ncbi:TSUP family transporter [Pseudorhodobacter sp. W20_MBD10_FR17]|uniref:TSUP family transporter n=1 Tax=Pseudorhodobacter sp. W20_MBD10_FR17 TaxID=3240266 RepID=UPI003F9C7C99